MIAQTTELSLTESDFDEEDGGSPQKLNDLQLAATVVSQSAKHFRDAGRQCFLAGDHEGARLNHAKMNELYQLKQTGLLHSAKDGDLRYHSVHSGVAAWYGDNFRFYCRFAPKGWVEDTGQAARTVRSNHASSPSETSKLRSKGVIKIPAVEFRGRVLLTGGDGRVEECPVRLKDAIYTLEQLTPLKPEDIGLESLPDPNLQRKEKERRARRTRRLRHRNGKRRK